MLALSDLDGTLTDRSAAFARWTDLAATGAGPAR